MTSEQLRAIALQDPFIRYYASAYLQTSQASSKSFDLYNNITASQEITDITEYLKLSAFFQSALEPAIGVSILFCYLKTVVNCIKPQLTLDIQSRVNGAECQVNHMRW